MKYIAENKPHIKLIGMFHLLLLVVLLTYYIAGFCFGHQIIARALGGECVPNDGKWEVGPTAMQLTAVGKQLFGDLDTVVSIPPYI